MRRQVLFLAITSALALGPSAAGATGAAAGPARATTTLDRTAIEATGLGSLGEVVQRLLASGSSLNRRYNGGGDGTVRADLRELGANRTLVLVDGRRWIAGLDGVVDLDSIPLASVERIEVHTGAQGARFGANAVAGAINVVTRRVSTGLELSGRYGEHAEGDGTEQGAGLALGSAGERASVTLIASYEKQAPVFAGARSFSAVPIPGLPANDVALGASSFTPFGQFRVGPGFGGPALTLIPGRSGASTSDFRAFDSTRDGFNLLPDNYLLTPSERTALFVAGRYALTETIAFRSEVLTNERRSEQRFAGFPLLLGAGALGSIAPTIRIPANQVFNPFGSEVAAIRFRPANAPRRFRQDADTTSFRAGFDGALGAFARDWHWSLDYGYADSETAGTSSGLFDLGRLALGLGPSFRDASGVARCGTPAAPIAGCVPVNLFGGPAGFTDAMRDYAAIVAQETTYTEQHRYAARVTGTLIELPAGPLGVLLGYDYRREAGFYQPDALVAAGGVGTSAEPRVSGRYGLDEVQLAVALPLLAGRRYAESLTLDLGARRASYRGFDRTLPSAGIRWHPFPGLELAGAWHRGLREPTLREQFEERVVGVSAILDPCAAARLRQLGSDVAARCRDGVGGVLPVPSFFEPNGLERATRGGNAALAPERALSRQLGLGWRPGMVEGLELALDWYAIELSRPIGILTANEVVNGCYLGGRIDFCRDIVRDATGQITNVVAGYRNLDGGTEVEGWDLSAGYRLDSRVGALAVSAAATYLAYYGNAERNAGDNLAGTFQGPGLTLPRLKAQMGVDWSRGDFGASVGARYRSALDEACGFVAARERRCSGGSATDPQFGSVANRQDSHWELDLQGRWDTPWNARLTLGVRNLLDEEPPFSLAPFEGNYDPELDPGGRFWYVGWTQRF